jgi:hypothetical protein
MKKSIYLIILNLLLICNGFSQEKNVSFVTTVGTTLRSVQVQANNIAKFNRMKIVGIRTTKQGDNWVRVVKLIPR